MRAVLYSGWVFCLPLALLIYLLFWKGFNPALSALAAAAALPVLMVIQKRKLISRSQWSAMLCGTGEALLPLLLIGAERLGSQRSALEAPKVEIGAQPAQRVLCYAEPPVVVRAEGNQVACFGLE